MTKRKREPEFSTDQERRILEVAKKVFREQFKGKPSAQINFGKALGRMSQSSVSDLLHGRYVPGTRRAEYLAQLAGYGSLKEMIGPYLHAPEDESAAETPSSVKVMTNLDRCIEYHGHDRWKPWVIAAARAGVFGDGDVSPKDWETRLNKLQAKKIA